MQEYQEKKTAIQAVTIASVSKEQKLDTLKAIKTVKENAQSFTDKLAESRKNSPPRTR